MLLNNAKASIQFKGKTYTKSDGTTQSFTDVNLYSCLINVAQSKIIVKTQRTGANGSVKEYVGMDDYHVIITGQITGSNGVYPTEDVLALRRMLECPVAIDVINTHLQNHGIYQVIVDSYEIPETEGGISFQSFSINLLQDSPVELKILSV